MKFYIFLLLASYSLLVSSSLKGIPQGEVRGLNVGSSNFTILTENYDLYDSKGVSMKLYREEENEDLTYLLTLVLEDKTGGCSGKSIQKGAFSVEGNILTFYHLWQRTGLVDDVPYGAKITRFEVQNDKTFKLLSSKIYIESHRQKKGDESGMAYLFTVAKTQNQKEKLDNYISHMEKIFEGKFLPAEEGKKLIEEVEEALTSKTKHAVWKNY